MNSTMPNRFTPAIILLLLASVVVVFSLLVIEKSQQGNHSAQQTTSSPENPTAIEWKLVTTWPKGFPGLGMGPERFADLVETMSNGRMRITVYGAGELVPALGIFDAVSTGSVAMGHGAAYYWKGKVPAAQFFTAVPFGLNVQETNGWLHHGDGLRLWRELYAPFNLIPMAGGSTGLQMGGWYNKEINTVDDLKGLKMRIPGLGGEVLNRAGGTAVNIPGGELFTALQTGVIDATEWVGPMNDLAFGFHQIAEYYYYPGWHEPGATMEFIVNKQMMESLPRDLQQIVTTAARAINQDMLDEYTARNNVALNELVSKHQVKLRRFPDDVYRKLAAIMEEVLLEQAEQDKDFARVLKSYQAFKRQSWQYHRISEQAYYNMRDLK